MSNSIRAHAFDRIDQSHASGLSVVPCAPRRSPTRGFAGLLVVTAAIVAALLVACEQGSRTAPRSGLTLVRARLGRDVGWVWHRTFATSAGPRRAFRLPQRLRARPLAVIGAVSLAYHYSLLSLARGFGLQTPLAYLALVPLITLVLGWLALRRESAQRPIHDRQLDYIIGLGLLLCAGAVEFLVPLTLAARFWLYRVDLLSLPIFAAGIVALFYGLRSLWTLRFPLAYLFLAWPVPYLSLALDGSRAFVDATSAALTALTHVVPTATAVAAVDTLFFVRHNAEQFPFEVSSASAGVNGLVGFILIGGAFAYVVDGPFVRRMFWLAAGLVLIWSLNIVRIEIIFAAGALFGQRVALDIFHSVAGLLALNLGVLAALIAVPRFGLGFPRLPPQGTGPQSPLVPYVHRLRPALIVGGGVALVMAIVNASYVRYEPFANAVGEARLARFDVRNARVANWEVVPVGNYEEGKAFFGASSTWSRILYTSTEDATLSANVPIYGDTIDTEDPNSLVAYGLEACYRVHGYRVEFEGHVEVESGVVAEVIDYHGTKENVDWSALWWEWPYRDGNKTMYQRVVLFVSNGPSATYTGIADDVTSPQAPRFRETNSFLLTVARRLVVGQIQNAQVP